MSVTYGGPDTNDLGYFSKNEARGKCYTCNKLDTCRHINYITVDCVDDNSIYNSCTIPWGSS